MHGCGSSLGESTLLGLLKGFPTRLVGAFGSGTGFAGVFGSGIFIVLKPFMSDGFIFLITTPIVLLYFMNIMIAIGRKNKYPFVEENPEAQERAQSIRKSMEHLDEVEEPTEEVDDNMEGIDIGEDVADNLKMNWVNAKLVYSKIGWYIFNIASVYYLEYT